MNMQLNEDERSLIWYMLKNAANARCNVVDDEYSMEHIETKDILTTLYRFELLNGLVYD